MEIQQQVCGGKACVSLAGELTIYQAAAAKDRLLAALAEAREVEMDLAGLAEIDTAGLQLLLLAKREATAAGRSLALTGHSRPVVEILELYGLAAWFGDPLPLPPAGEEP